MRLRFPVDIAQRRSRLNPRTLSRLIHAHGLHLRTIDDEAAIAQRVPRDTVPAAPHRKKQPVIARETHCRDNIGRPGASDDQTGLAVDHAVPYFSRLVIRLVTGANQLPL
jgi:hypothetical protein